MDRGDGGPTRAVRRRAVPDGRRGAVRIAEVAAKAGVSTATVSRTLANPERVSVETRARVLEVVRLTGYTPNLAGRSLRAARSMMALVMVPTVVTPFFSALLLGIDRALAAHGYGLLVGHDAREKGRHLADVVLAGQADGVIVLDGRIPRGTARSLDEAGVPVVAVSVPPASADVPAVLVQDREGGILVARHLLGLGHRRFGYVTGPAQAYAEQERWAGFRGTLAMAGIPEATVARWPGDYHVGTGVAAGERFLGTTERPTAVFAASDMMAIGFLRTVRAAGVRVPDDVAVVGFDGIEFADYCEPPLTTIRQPREAMGREAAELLVRLIRGKPVPEAERSRRLEVTLRVAGSTVPTGRGDAALALPAGGGS